MSRAELKRMVEESTAEEQQFLFVCLAEKLDPNSQQQVEGMDQRLADMDSGRKRLTLEEFEERLDRRAPE